MTLPNFLGIGAMRSGTSWLYEQLRGASRHLHVRAKKSSTSSIISMITAWTGTADISRRRKQLSIQSNRRNHAYLYG